MTIGIIAFTSAGGTLGEKLSAVLRERGNWVMMSRCGRVRLSDWTERHFASDDALVFIGAAGIAVRAVAPLLKSKTTDPAVIVVDELGKFSISLLSGHIGGANRLANDIAGILGAIPVITTATDIRNVFAVDVWAGEKGIKIINPERIKYVSGALLAGKTVRLKSDFPLEGKLPNGFIRDDEKYDVAVSIRAGGEKDALLLVPPVLTLGVGCKKGTQTGELERAFKTLLGEAGCRVEAVSRVCSIDLKAKEPGILEFCAAHRFTFETFSASRLGEAAGSFTSSEFVRQITGVDNVCERSAVLGSGGELLTRRYAENGVTMALAEAPYTVRFMEEL